MASASLNDREARKRYLRVALAPLLLAALGAALLLAFPSPARADESPFASIYTTEVMPQGAREFEQWLTWRTDKPDENYDRLQGRTEFEYGVSDRFLAAFYLNYERTKNVPYGPGAPDGPKDKTDFTGVNFEFIYQVLNPYTQPIGFALYFEPSIGAGTRALEWKLLFQKNFLEDQLILAANIILEYEWARLATSSGWERESALEIFLGASYRVAPGWFLGAELLNKNGYANLLFDNAHAETNAFYLGPVVHYASERWWATLAVYRQLPWAGNPGNSSGAIVNGFLVGAERTRVRFRLGIPF